MRPRLSFVVPFKDEAATLRELTVRIDETVRAGLGPGETYELWFVDDGSRDDSVRTVEQLIAERPEVHLLELQGNFGKSAALAAGFAEARGDVVFTLDADLQDDPKEIPRFLAKLEEGFDLVSGYKEKRNDPISKVLPSRVFNALVRRLTGIRLHDVNCGFKAYRAVVLKNLRLYGEMHRFVPVLAHWKRFKIGEIVVQHHARKFGESKFGGGRFFRGLMDLLTVFFLLKYERRPAHFFGGVGVMLLMAGFAVLSYLTVLWAQGEPIGKRPLLILGVLCVVVGVQVLATGLIAELIVHLGAGHAPYVVRRRLEHSSEPSSRTTSVLKASGEVPS
ncbi:MAG TPA: glycosyltransferase family 2 protein [Polyangiaceae bacterium]|nr:glycosyltransferase family 2 protein [Polyangiaceae bacterium]